MILVLRQPNQRNLSDPFKLQCLNDLSILYLSKQTSQFSPVVVHFRRFFYYDGYFLVILVRQVIIEKVQKGVEQQTWTVFKSSGGGGQETG